MSRSKLKTLLYARIQRAFIETGFIIFLFYSNLLMGEYNKTGNGNKNGFLWALHDIFTITNFEIAFGAAIVGYVVVEFLRKNI